MVDILGVKAGAWRRILNHCASITQLWNPRAAHNRSAPEGCKIGEKSRQAMKLAKCRKAHDSSKGLLDKLSDYAVLEAVTRSTRLDAVRDLSLRNILFHVAKPADILSKTRA